ncbi:MAG: hypothetical protein KC416_15670, partial [Myxococcales bacterium]|nr:hypothetical protein [Myxococcales bacterium]
MNARIALVGSALLSLSLVSTAFAQDGVTAEGVAQDEKEEKFKEGQFVEGVPPEEVVDEDTDWNASAGGILNTGNTRQVALNAGSYFRLVRGAHGVGAEGAIVYSTADTGSGYEENAFNGNLKLRY